MARAAALALVLFTLAAGDARAAQEFQVYTADLPIADYSNGAIGLLVPGAGPNTSNEQALQALRSGKAVNSLRCGNFQRAHFIAADLMLRSRCRTLKTLVMPSTSMAY